MNFLRGKSSTKTLVLSLVIVGICILIFSVVFLYIGNMGNGVVNADELKDVKTLSATNTKASSLKIRVNYNDQKVPRNAVSPQYAAALATDITKRVFGKTPTGRVTIDLCDPSDIIYGDYPAWNAFVEVENGYVSCMVHALKGFDVTADYYVGDDHKGDFQYTWKNAKDNDSEIPYANSENNSKSTSKDAEDNPEASAKRELSKQYIEHKKDLPHGKKALEFVKKTKLANDAAPISGQIVMGDADEGEETEYKVEVKLDNKKSIILTMKADNMSVIGYERYETNFLDTMYPVK